MKKVVVTGKTVEEAVKSALVQLNATEEQVNINVLEQPSKGLFGFIGSKNAEVEVTLKEDPIGKAKIFLSEVLSKMGVAAQIELIHQADHVVFHLVGDQLGIIIGKRGQTLDSLQYLINVVANRTGNGHLRIVLDAENYRNRRKETLEGLSERLASRVAKTKKEVVLEPMTPHERKIIHAHLQSLGTVATYSKGEEPNRRLVIIPKD